MSESIPRRRTERLEIEAMVDAAAEKGFTRAIWAGPLGTLARLLWFLLLCSILFVVGLVKGNFPILQALIFAI